MKKLIQYSFIIIVIFIFIGCDRKEKLPNIVTIEPAIEENNRTEVPTKEPETPELIDKEEPSITPKETQSPIPNIDNTEEFVEKQEGITSIATLYGMTEDILDNMTLEEKIGQLFIVNFELLDDSKGSFYEFRKLTEKMKKSIEKYKIGGVIFFARNIETREQTKKFVKKLQQTSKIPLFITVDEEGGDVSRIASNDNMNTTKFPSMQTVGEMEDEDYTYEMGKTLGREIRQLGFNVNYAPVADVLTNNSNTEIGNRAFGSDAKLVSRMVKQVVRGLEEEGISSTLKHFPGHGSVSEDSHDGAVNVETDLASLRKVEFQPFKAGIKAGADFIMVSHISISRITENTMPASLSPLVMQQIIREELKFDKIIITDALNMKSITDHYSVKRAVLTSFQAGSDILLMPANLKEAYQAIYDAVKKGTITEERINESVHRILKVKLSKGLIGIDTHLIQKKPIE